ncbi:glutathione S-transferase [Methylomonas paludis]|uniref:Glutathione S-transferase n=1 Tax=Methylomonas paludis TaxID=1173101 RepID=A0A975MQ26_9GAMM|nr:glutathione S-transferase [Methylomonas paludis]QWF71426.1 glutathione S-transferase [Methylomonas paludis]
MTPILYSFRRCPYAMRARLALAVAQISVELREVALRNKPAELLNISPKATVPVLQLDNGKVLEQSLDIMDWALAQNDPEHWLESASHSQARQLISENDGQFKYYLDRYKYPDRYPQHSQQFYRQQAEIFIQTLENCLQKQAFLCGGHFALADAAILPFIRQFAAVDSDWFNNAPYPSVQQWLANFIDSGIFAAIMPAYPVWQPNSPVLYFPAT